jgi:hypothetical protein
MPLGLPSSGTHQQEIDRINRMTKEKEQRGPAASVCRVGVFALHVNHVNPVYKNSDYFAPTKLGDLFYHSAS